VVAFYEERFYFVVVTQIVLGGEGGKGRTAHKADNLTAICEPIFWKMWRSLDVSQPCGPPRPLYLYRVVEGTRKLNFKVNMELKLF
jgi:hypothetical protein